MSRWDISWLKENRPLLIAEIIGIPVVVAWLLYAYFHGHVGFALVILVLLPVFVAANVLLINRSRKRQADPSTRRDVPTGTLLAPESPDPTIPDLAATRWVGAADVPGALGRMNASTPLAVLELTGSFLTLRVRPQFLARLFGMRTLQVQPFGVDAIFPAKGRLRYPAVCVRPHGEPPYYFLVKDRAPILTALAAAGFPIIWEERAYSQS
jgi:hypothetical protein